jgi:hypothetical protein
MVLAGVVAVGEIHYLRHGPDGCPYADPNEISFASLAPAHDAGIRITLLDTMYLRGGFDAAPSPTQPRFSEDSVEHDVVTGT